MKKLMKEIDKVMAMHPQALIYLGTIEGSGWLIIDTAENFSKKIDEWNLKNYTQLEKMRNTKSEEVNDYWNRLVNKGGHVIAHFDILDKMYRAARAYNRIDFQLRNYIPFRDRKVCEQVYIDQDEPGFGIRIEGNETSGLWWRNEHATIFD